jgi:hypothetical protein
MNIRRILVATDFSEGARAAASGPRGESRGKDALFGATAERGPSARLRGRSWPWSAGQRTPAGACWCPSTL